MKRDWWAISMGSICLPIYPSWGIHLQAPPKSYILQRNLESLHRIKGSRKLKRKAETRKEAMATIDESTSAKRWLPLEANPDVMNQVFFYFIIFYLNNFAFMFTFLLVSDLEKMIHFWEINGVLVHFRFDFFFFKIFRKSQTTWRRSSIRLLALGSWHYVFLFFWDSFAAKHTFKFF